MYEDYHFYIDLNWEDAVDKQIGVYLDELYSLVELAYQYKGTVYYDGRQLQLLKKAIDIECNLDENFSVSYGNKIDLILKNATKATNFAYAFQICFANENTSLNYINSIYSVINQHNKISIISFSKTIETLLSVKTDTDLCKIDCLNIQNRNSIIHWITTNSTRIFNPNPKHGENGCGNWQGQSALLCSKEDAQIWLNTAVPCFSDNEKRLYNFDTQYNTYIIFYYEGNNPQNQWHGFHINDDEWNKEIPNFIKKHFRH